MKKFNLYKKLLLGFVIVTIFLNLLGFSKAFCDVYTDSFYPLLNLLLGAITSPLPFALGEILMYMAALLLIFFLIFSLIRLFVKKNGYKVFYKGYAKTVLMTAVIFLFLYTTNWFIPFRCTVLSPGSNNRTAYNFEEVSQVYRIIVSNLNELSAKVPRDQNGYVIYDYTQQDIVDAMKNISTSYPRLSGHYSNMKIALCSDVLDWMGIGGYNYIYTMEPTYNRYVDRLYLPTLLAHEYAHHKGYYRENEGEFLSTMALIHSDNPVLQYSAYYEMYLYITDALIESACNMIHPGDPNFTPTDLALMKSIMKDYPTINQQVLTDRINARKEAEDLYESQKNPSAEKNFKKTAVRVSKTGWETQANILQENCYSGLSLMLLQYYLSEENQQ